QTRKCEIWTRGVICRSKSRAATAAFSLKCTRGRDREHKRGCGRAAAGVFRPSARTVNALLHRDVGAVLLLRDARDPGVLPVLLGRRGWPGNPGVHRAVPG